MLMTQKTAAADPATVAAIKRILQGSLAMGGLGIAGRVGLEAMVPAQPPQIPFVSPGPSDVPITIPEQVKKKQLQKTANGPVVSGTWTDWLARKMAPMMEKTDQYLGTPTNPRYRAGMIPLGVGLGVAAPIGGYMLADKILDARRKQLSDQDVEAAQKDYANALSGTSKLASVVDEMADALVKQASGPLSSSAANPGGGNRWSDAANIGGGMWLTGLLTSLGLGAGAGYHWASKGSKPALYNRALKDRAKKMWQSQQQPLHFVPAPQSRQELNVS